jgi:hypothetical protein
VKLLRHSKDRFVFQLGKRERQLLLAVLELYPRLSTAHQKLSKSAAAPAAEADQQLLEEALAEQRAENKKELMALLSDPKRSRPEPAGVRLSLAPVDLERLLQVLNDIRVGSWVRLGSPEEHLDILDEKTAPDIWAMEMSGFFQMHLLEAMGAGGAWPQA